MVLAVPAVIDKAALLRREGSGLVDGHHVLGEHDPPFQLAPAGIGTPREVDGTAALPELAPVPGAGASGLGEGRHGGIAHDLVEANHKTDLPRIGGGNQFVTVLLRPAEHCPGVPLHVDIVIRIVELPVEAGHMCPGRKLRKVPSGAVPVGGTAEFRVRRERKPQRDADRSVGHFFRLDPHGHGVLLRMPDSRYDHLPAVDAITARRRPRPQVEPLHGIGQIPDPGPRAVVLYQHQPDAPQVDPLRVAHHPVAQRPLLGIGNVIAHHTALRLPFRAPEIFGALPLRQRETVPAPVRHRIGIVRKGLHTADIEPEGELPVADLHRPAQIALPDFGVMARYDRFAVYFPGRIRRMRKRQQGCTQNKGGSPGGPGQISGRDFSIHIGSGLGFVFHLKSLRFRPSGRQPQAVHREPFFPYYKIAPYFQNGRRIN